MRRIILLLIALGFAVSARADVSDSGNLTIGGTGVIQGTMTVQGAAFSVGGTTFSVAGGSITLGGRLNAAAAGIKWADGSTSTTSFSGSGSGTISATSVTFYDAGLSWNSGFGALGPCIVGTTVTVVTTSTGPLIIDFAGAAAGSANTEVYGLGFLIDGAFPDGSQSQSRSYISWRWLTSSWYPLTIYYRTTANYPPGAHSVCLTGEDDAGTGSVFCDSVGRPRCHLRISGGL